MGVVDGDNVGGEAAATCVVVRDSLPSHHLVLRVPGRLFVIFKFRDIITRDILFFSTRESPVDGIPMTGESATFRWSGASQKMLSTMKFATHSLLAKL